jgi:CHAT domain-containing protein
LIAERIAYLKENKPASVTYFFAVQNLEALTSRQKKYDEALDLALKTLNELKGSDRKYGQVCSTLQYDVGNICRWHKQHVLSQEYDRLAHPLYWAPFVLVGEGQKR